MSVIDLVGQRFGKWTAVSRAENIGTRAAWLCRCECGNQRAVEGKSLRRGDSTKCEHCKNLTHGHSHRAGRSPTFDTWIAMWQRCTNPKASNYHRYGGRGITVDSHWDSFDVFLADMGERPRGMTIDRIDNDRKYEHSNCRWATRKEQARTHRHDAIGRFVAKAA